ncbi:hypothetical protein MMC22_000932 [Lobaria immixta]|nr:hypothetical protein [Lobaria immixta]
MHRTAVLLAGTRQISTSMRAVWGYALQVHFTPAKTPMIAACLSATTWTQLNAVSPELLNALSGGKYVDRNDHVTHGAQISLDDGTHKGCVETDSYVYKAFNGHVYYVKKSNASTSTPIESLWSLGEYDLLKEFIIRHADLVREEQMKAPSTLPVKSEIAGPIASYLGLGNSRYIFQPSAI